MNLVDIYLQINGCRRDKSNKVYFGTGDKEELVGVLKKHYIENGTLYIEFESYSPIKFLNIQATFKVNDSF